MGRQKILSLLILTGNFISSAALGSLALIDEARIRPEYFSGIGGFSPQVQDAADTSFRARLGLTSEFLNDFSFQIVEQGLGIWPMNTGSSNAYGILYQGWVQWRPFDFWQIKVGRQEINLGSERLVGRADWSAWGRFFDAARMDLELGLHSLTLFYSRIDSSTSSGGINSLGSGQDFFGGYATLRTTALDALDFYFFYNSNFPGLNLFSAGGRLNSRWENFFVEIEGTDQWGQIQGSPPVAEFQVDAELGPVLEVFQGLDLTYEYAYASKGFNQLFPSAHEFLGEMDYYGRRNIIDSCIHARLRMPERFTIKLALHDFFTADNSKGSPPFTINSVAIPPAPQIPVSDSNALGLEFDSTIEKVWSSFALALGLSYYQMGSYYRDVNPYASSTVFTYFQTRASF